MSAENEQSQEPQSKVYVCRNYPLLKTRLGDRRVRFENGRLELTDPEEIEIMDQALRTNMFMKAHIRVVDYAKGVEVVKAHQAQLAAKRGTSSGPVTGELIRKARKPMQRDEALRQSGIDPASIQGYLADDGTMEMSLEDPSIAAAADADRAAPAVKQETADDIAKTASDFDTALQGAASKTTKPAFAGLKKGS